MKLGEVYFWTDTIKDWKQLLKPDKYKHIIVRDALAIRMGSRQVIEQKLDYIHENSMQERWSLTDGRPGGLPLVVRSLLYD